MTHAALKDLENKWRAEAMDYEPGPYSTGPDRDLLRRCDELSAALSAAEGEAVAPEYQELIDAAQPFTVEGNTSNNRRLRLLKALEKSPPPSLNARFIGNPSGTAPPPQQAAGGAQGDSKFPMDPDDEQVNEIVSALYRRFKEWSKRGFSADDVTWCEVKRDVMQLILATQAQQAGGDAVYALAVGVAEKLVQDWHEQGRMPPMGWNFREFAVDAITRAFASTHPQPEAGGGVLTFEAFRAANVARCIKWHPEGIKALVAKWRDDVRTLYGYGPAGMAIRACADELESLPAVAGDAPKHPVPQPWIEDGGLFARIRESLYGPAISFSCDEAVKAFDKFFPTRQAVEGMVLVPRVPTDSMKDAMAKACGGCTFGYHDRETGVYETDREMAEEIYRAMLAAAAPQAGKENKGG